MSRHFIYSTVLLSLVLLFLSVQVYGVYSYFTIFILTSVVLYLSIYIFKTSKEEKKNKYDLIQWTDKYELGIKKLTNEHKKLVGLSNELCIAVEDGYGSNYIRSLVVSLISYMKYHQKNEETMMRVYGTGNRLATIERPSDKPIKEHKDEHLATIKRMEYILENADFLSEKGLREMYDLIKSEVSAHVGKTDRQLGQWFAFCVNKEKEIREVSSKGIA